MENFISRMHEWLKWPYRLKVHETGQGPTVVMLHGIATSSKSWEHLIAFLKNDFRCITIDLLGFGDSPKPEWYSYTPEEHVKNIHRTISKLNIDGPFILIGHSMGSLLALHYANRHPQNVKHLYMLSPPIYMTKSDIKAAKKIWRDTLYARAYKYIRTHKKFTLKGVRGLKLLALKNNPFYINETTWNSFSKSLEECIEKQTVVKDLEQLDCPADIIYGSLDQLLIKKNIRKLDMFSNVKIHPIRNGHLINVRYARLVAELVYLVGKQDNAMDSVSR